MKYEVKLIKTDEGYSIHCPSLKGCWSQGKTEEEALENIKEAIQLYLEAIEEVEKRKVTMFVEV